MVIQQDTRQKQKHHLNKEKWFESHGYKVVNSKMLVGDYCIPNDGSISVDTKKDIGELYSNLVQQHDRFVRELSLAQEIGIKLYILVENEQGIKDIKGILRWENPQYFVWLKKQRQGIKCRRPVPNQQLLKMMCTIEKRYGCTFLFCSPYESAEKIVALLTKVEGDTPTPLP